MLTKSLLARNAALDSLALLFANGWLNIYSGPKPASPDQPATGELLVQFRFPSDPFEDAADGLITAREIPVSAALRTGTATWCRSFMADGATAIMDGDVGSGGAAFLNFKTTLISADAEVSIDLFTISQPA